MSRPQDEHNNNAIPPEHHRLAPFNPTCLHAQHIALDMLQLTNSDILFDLGCGDGRFLIEALKTTPQGLRCVGIEVDPMYVNRARENVEQWLQEQRQENNKPNSIDIRLGDVMEEITTTVATTTGIEDATAIFLYLLPDGLRKLAPHLQALRNKEGVRIVSYMFAIPGWDHDSVDRSTKGDCPVYLYKGSG